MPDLDRRHRAGAVLREERGARRKLGHITEGGEDSSAGLRIYWFAVDDFDYCIEGITANNILPHLLLSDLVTGP